MPAGRPRKKISDPVLKEWLGEFKKESTKEVYCSAIRLFKKSLKIKDLGEYLQSGPDASGDIKKFLNSLDGRPSKTVAAYVTAVRMFFQDQGVNMKVNEWKKIRRRGFMPRRIRAETRDKKPAKTQLKQLLNYADIKARAMILFLVSSGSRIGETLQLKKEDFDLEADPPKAHIRTEYTKGGVGGRIVFFSYEARDAIKDWLRIKNNMGKRQSGNETYKDERVFPWSHNTACFMWNTACDKAGIGEKDKHTGRRVYHLHSLRKFFRTKIGLDLDIVSALMGHVEGLDKAYVRLDQDREIAQAYLEAMPNVSVYAVQSEEMKSIEDENRILKERLSNLEAEFRTLKGLLVESLNGNK